MKTKAEKCTDRPAAIRRKPFFSPVGAPAFFSSSRVQPKLRVAPPDDRFEQEADRVADQVMRMPCPECAQQTRRKGVEGEQSLQAKTEPGRSAEVPSALASQIQSFGSGGRPLPESSRRFFEPRLNRNFGAVRVHTGGQAERAARSLNARAFTLGRDIAFAPGEYAPETTSGRQLLAHELTHVVQQRHDDRPVIRRLSYGRGRPPAWRNLTLAPVPADERDHVNEAIAIVDDVVNHPDRYSECHDQFAERCPNGNQNTLATVWGRAVLWRITSPDPGALARGDVGGQNLAYTQSGYEQSPEGLAQTLMHEAGHNCGIPGGDPHWRADQIATYCIAPRNEISLAFGGYTAGQALMLLSYRRFLGDWASGRLRATLGADLNVIGTAGEIAEAGAGIPESARPVGEFGSVMAGLQGRLGGWGGSRYGGFTARVETGFGVGRFTLRPPGPDDPVSTTIAPSWILQVGPRAEFLVPDPFTEGRVLPFSVGAAYRFAQPVNPDAEQLHGIFGTLEGRF